MDELGEMKGRGVIVLDEPGVKIDPATVATVFMKAAGGYDEMKMGEVWTSFEFKKCKIGGVRAIVTVWFEKERMDRTELFFPQSDDGTSWADWSEEKERRRKEAGEKWVAGFFEKEMVVKPFEVDGKMVMPFELTWETGRHAVFEWGEVVSYFDSKGGMAEVAVRYKGAKE